jgi:hypothetical protein
VDELRRLASISSSGERHDPVGLVQRVLHPPSREAVDGSAINYADAIITMLPRKPVGEDECRVSVM